MANTKIPSELIDGTLGVAGISSSADATAITIGSDESVDFAKGIVVEGSGTLAGVYLNGTNSDTATQGNFVRYGTNFATQSNAANDVLITKAFNGSTFVDALNVKSDGNVGIGTASPNQDGFDANATVLSVKSANNGEGVLELIGGGNSSGDQISVINFMSQAQANPAGQIIALRGSADDESSITFNNSGAERMRIKSSGEVGIGTTNPAGKFQVEGSHSGQIGYFNQTGTGGGNHGVYIDSASTGGWTFLARNGGTARFGITGTEARFFNGVTVQAGTSTSDKGGHIRTWAGSGYIGLTGDLTGYTAGSYSTLKASGSYIYFDISQTYSAYMSSNGVINANSDRRLKENIETLSTGQLDKVCNLRGVNFNWIDQRVTGNQVGLIAQEVQEEYPELVGDGGVEDGTLTVNYAGSVSYTHLRAHET